jgi:hypothetical protein
VSFRPLRCRTTIESLPGRGVPGTRCWLWRQWGRFGGLIRGSDRAGRLARLQAPTSLRSVGSAYSDRGELRVSVGDGQ